MEENSGKVGGMCNRLYQSCKSTQDAERGTKCMLWQCTMVLKYEIRIV